MTDDDSASERTIVRSSPRWLGSVLAFAAGVVTGALLLGMATSSPEPDINFEKAVVAGCGSDLTLIVDARDLQSGPYELRATVGDRMLPMVNSMTYALIGTHEDHQSVEPRDGRLLVVANVPVGKGNPLRYELVDSESDVVSSGTLQPASCG